MSIVYLDNTGYEINDEFSQRDFTGQNLRHRAIPPGSVIYQSCFAQQTPDSIILPEPLIGVTFINCNLDNVYIPEGNAIIGGSCDRHEVQEDGLDWIISKHGEPVRLKNEKHHRLRIMRELEEAGLAVTYPPVIPVPRKQNKFIKYLKRIWSKLWQ